MKRTLRKTVRGRNHKRGMTLFEVLAATTISSMTLIGGVAVYISGMMSWTKGEGAIDSLNNAQNPIRLVSMELREATKVQVNSAGTYLSYELPLKDSSGDYVLPLQSDSTVRYFQLLNDDLIQVVGSRSRVIAKHVLPQDPQTGQSYKIFQTNGAAIARQVIVQIAASRQGYQENWEPTRARESICLRNVPQLTR
jgi:Tfp pilus assembly protein PilW